MLQKLLSGYPEDVIHRSSYYQYEKVIDTFRITPKELQLLNKINVHHARLEYSRQPFSSNEELVRVSDFIPFYEHLRVISRAKSAQQNTSSNLLRSLLPQQTLRRPSDFPNKVSNAAHIQSTQSPSYTTPQLFYENIPSTSRPIMSTSTVSYPSRPSDPGVSLLGQSRQSAQLRQESPSSFIQQPIATSSNTINNFPNKVFPDKSYAVPVTTSSSQYSASVASALGSNLAFSTFAELSSSLITKQKSSTSKQSLPPPVLSTSVAKSPRLHSGWLQINKLYTPYVSADAAVHHLYKIPVSLLTFYDLLKMPSNDNTTGESMDYPSSFKQMLVTPQEIELVNELCLKQNIKPFSIDTKLIDLFTFYQHCSSSIVFVKELILDEPKSSICKDWSSVVQIEGGICRLRNTTTLHEQTVPFIGKNLLKNFIISSACLASASLTNPTSLELEFLQLILFFSNLPISLRNAKLIDIESVQKEYNVDLILYFNDKFPLNVLDCQQQNNRLSTSLERPAPTDSSAATNMFAESTPPPSPPSPPTKKNVTTKSMSSSPTTSDASVPSNRYQKTILFHGHTMTAYICSGFGSDAQRECISVKALCNVLYPNSSILDKLEVRFLRLLRMKNINRFRPQNQQSMGFTRLIDVKDIEKHWDYIQQGMHSASNDDEGQNTVLKVTSSLPNTDWTASTLDTLANETNEVARETSTEVTKTNKRTLQRTSIDEDVPLSKRNDSHIRSLSDGVDDEPSISTPSKSMETSHKTYTQSDDNDETEKDDENNRTYRVVQFKNRPRSTLSVRETRQKDAKKATNKKLSAQKERTASNSSIISKKSTVPMKKKKIKLTRKRSGKKTVAAWVRKYNIEDCCIRLNACDPMYGIGKHRLC